MRGPSTAHSAANNKIKGNYGEVLADRGRLHPEDNDLLSSSLCFVTLSLENVNGGTVKLPLSSPLPCSSSRKDCLPTSPLDGNFCLLGFNALSFGIGFS